MKLVIFGLPNQIGEEEIAKAMSNVVKTLGVNIKVTVLERNDVLPSANEPIFISRKEESEYVQAVKKIMETCGDIVHSVSDRTKFYELVVKKVIEKPILEVLAFGPKSGRELAALKDAGGQEFVSICRTALALNESL